MYRLKSKSPFGHLSVYRKQPLVFLESFLETNEDIASFRFAHQQIYLLLHPDLIKEVLVTKQASFHKSKPFQELEPLLGEGLLLSEGEHHLRQRRFLQPFFTQSHIKTYAKTMAETTLEYIKGWGDQERRMISKDMMELALGIITKTMFSMDIEDGHEKVGKHLDAALNIATKRIRSIIKSPRSWKTKENQAFRQAVKALDEVVYSMIEKRKQEETKYDDLLGVLMDAADENDGAKMKIDQLRDEVMTIFLAGHETTATALTWTLYTLTQNNEIANGVREEVDAICKGDAPTYEEAMQLSYTRNVILEGMRMYPPAWLFGRVAVEDVTVGSVNIKKGETVMISPYVMHQHPKYIENPAVFNPNRFEKGKLRNTSDYVFFPFGGGSRVCIGQHFAMLEAVIVLAVLMKNYHFSSPENEFLVEFEPLITLRPKNGLELNVEKRYERY